MKQEGNKIYFYAKHALVDLKLIDLMWDSTTDNAKPFDSRLLTADIDGKSVLTSAETRIERIDYLRECIQ